MRKVPSLWHPCDDIDPNEFYQKRVEVPPLIKNREKRNEVLVGYVESAPKAFAVENVLPTVIQSTYYTKNKESGPHLLTRLLQKEKRLGLDNQLLAKESQIRRNKLVVEHVMAERNRRQWEQEVLTEI